MSLLSSRYTRPKPLPKDMPADVNVIENLKKQTSEMESQIRILKTKIQRSNSIITARKRAVKSVYSVPKEKQKICTASDSNISYLKKDIESLKKTKEHLEKTLHSLLYSDKFDISRELKIDVLTHYAEQRRLNDMLYELDMNNKLRARRTSELIKIIDEAPERRRESIQLEYSINDSNDRLSSYYRANQKDEINKVFLLVESGQSDQAVSQQLEKEISDLQRQLEEAKRDEQFQYELAEQAREGLLQAFDAAKERLLGAVNPDVSEPM